MDKRKAIYDIIKKLEEVNGDIKRSFNVVLSYFAYKLGVKNSTYSAKNEERDILKSLDVETFREGDCTDFLGEVYEEIFGVKMTSYKDIEKRARNVRFNVREGKIKSLCLRGCETGRTIMSFFKKDNSIKFYATESDEELYKIAIVNVKLYNIPNRIYLDKTPHGTSGWKVPSPRLFKNCQTNTWI